MPNEANLENKNPSFSLSGADSRPYVIHLTVGIMTIRSFNFKEVYLFYSHFPPKIIKNQVLWKLLDIFYFHYEVRYLWFQNKESSRNGMLESPAKSAYTYIIDIFHS